MNKSKLFKLAHKIKNLFENFSKALKAAWKIMKISMGIPTRIVFANSDGEERKALAINMGSFSTIEKGFVRFVEQLENGLTQWRSFRIERLIAS